MNPKRKWTPEEIEKLKELKRQRKSRWQIAKELGRPIGSVIAKLDTHEGQIIPVGVIKQLMVPSTVVEERDRVTQAGHRDYTAEFCGDPLIGRSALDRTRTIT